ncbi:hypothetical protein BpHYR1_016175 [Brachionus plicatilis]|uniref:Uncharacterized protein n=1 Tax=Brachionus plicatilis TaxID=10195 RepID=A0A3M7PFB4_BRAPC|nr:hypothetical protein BpHYR1_016175 [Brachionus plicatilis]
MMEKVLKERYVNVSIVLVRIKMELLKIEWRKCKWFQLSMEYLGHIVCNGEVRPAPVQTPAPVPDIEVEDQDYVDLADVLKRKKKRSVFVLLQKQI